ncbi:hypothetical protein WR25_23614 [Diploscapter pachys]|uniref:PPM-type phosphatase domain-containing protein n=1 Tax=Diploscapter pachys TaxID=2018661 RepID=A0A2A2J722_9BILA|nr:hypothetical protein WR25_23614 [Diploscapter pachys]
MSSASNTLPVPLSSSESSESHNDNNQLNLNSNGTIPSEKSEFDTSPNRPDDLVGKPLVAEENNDQVQPLPIVRLQQVPRVQLRTWRITREGLVLTGESQMGAFLDKPKTAKTNLSGEGNGLRYAMASMQGWRIDMEDAHVVEVSMTEQEPYKDWSFFAVFDGHAGTFAADDAAENIMKTLISTPEFEKATEELKSNGGVLCKKSISLLENGIKRGFLLLDDIIRERLNTDRSGSTAVCAMVTPTHIIIANLGDSRAVVARKGEESFGTEDHKPYHDKERERIVSAGGSVMIQRINGSLAVSRALGDFEYKNVPGLDACRQLVSPEPDVYILERHKDKDEFLVVACDGIYDVMDNEALCKFVESRLGVNEDLNIVCNEVLDMCLSRGSRDNMTMIIVCFDAAPKIDPEKADAEKEWRKRIFKIIDEILESEKAQDMITKGDEMPVEWVVSQLAAHPNAPQTSEGPSYTARSLIAQVLNQRGITHDG